MNGYVKTLSERWAELNFRTQLMASHGLLVLTALVVTTLVSALAAEKILLSRGFDLLAATNGAAVKMFRDQVEMPVEQVCGPDDKVFWDGLVKSKYFLRVDPPGPKRSSAFSFGEGADRALLRFASPCGKPGGAVAVLRADWLSALFNDRTGLGTSGETYLLAGDGKLVTESRFLNNPLLAPVPSQLPEHWQGVKNDYRGIPVLAAWTRVSLGDFHGFIASEIDEAEVRGPVRRLLFAVFAFTALMLALTAFGVPWLARALSHNLERAHELEQVKNIALIEGQERERRRISLELHDDIGQKLTALGWRVATGNESQESLAGHVRTLAQQVRSLSTDLSNMLVQEVGLVKALQQLVDDADAMRINNVHFQFEIVGEPVELTQNASTAIYRVAQESLANVVKHSQAREACYTLTFDQAKVSLNVVDDGRGVDAGLPQNTTGLGLKSMRARAEAFNGTFQFRSSPQQGTRVTLVLPTEGNTK